MSMQYTVMLSAAKHLTEESMNLNAAGEMLHFVQHDMVWYGLKAMYLTVLMQQCILLHAILRILYRTPL